MNIRMAIPKDINLLSSKEIHIDQETILNKINANTIIIAFEEETFIGWLRFNYFWDEHPFMNMLYIEETFRDKGYGSKLVEFWEVTMKELGFNLCMVSTMSNETSQEFYRKLGYKDIGGFVLEGEPMELMMCKKI